MAEHTYDFNITMTCSGCSGAVERVLKKLDGLSDLPGHKQKGVSNANAGVKDYKVSLDDQTAHIVTEESLPYATVLEKIKKTGKTVTSGKADGETMAV